MNKVVGARVVIIDDDFEEVKPLVAALSKRQIAACWYSGDVTQLPEEPVQMASLRMAFLDIDLAGGGTSAHDKVNSLVSVMARIFTRTTAGYGAILWTKHGELRRQFIEALLRTSVPLPLFIATIAKDDCKKNGAFDLARIERQLQRGLRAATPWDIIWRWERDHISAGGELINSLAQLCRPATLPTADQLQTWQGTWDGNLSTLLVKLAQEELGADNLVSGRQVVQGIYSTLAFLLTDSAETTWTKAFTALNRSGANLVGRVPNPRLDASMLGRINEMLCFTEKTQALLSGNVYFARTRGVRNAIANIPRHKDIVKDVIQSPQHLSAVTSASEVVLVEVSPTCDHVQGKIRQCRLLAGVRVSADQANRLKKAEFLWSLGPFHHKGANSCLVIDLRQLFTCNKTILTSLRPTWRLRQQVLTELQNRFATHASRAAVLCLREK